MDLFNLMATLGLDSSSYEKGLDGAESRAGSFGSKLKSGLGKAAKVGAAAVTAVATATAGATAAMVKGASETAAYGDNIDKMSQKMGMSATAYQEWDAVMQHAGSSVENLKGGFRTLTKQLTDATKTIDDVSEAEGELERKLESGEISLDEYNEQYDALYESGYKSIEAFDKLGFSMQEVEDMAQDPEAAFSNIIKRLQEMPEGTERTALAMELLGRSAMELGPLLNTSAEETQAMKDRVHELGGVMSDEAVKASATFQDNLQDLQTAFAGVKRGITENLLPGLNDVMAGFTSLIIGEEGAQEALDQGFSQIMEGIMTGMEKVTTIASILIPSLVTAITEILPELAPMGISIIESIATAIIDNLPGLVDAAISILSAIGEALIENGPTLIESLATVIGQVLEKLTNPETLGSFIDGIILLVTTMAETFIENIPAIIDAIIQILDNLLQVIRENLPKIVEAAVSIMTSLINGLIEALPKLVAYIPTIINTIMEVITENLPTIIQAAIDIMNALVEGLIEAIPTLVEYLPTILNTIADVIFENLPTIIQAGFDLLEALIDGIMSNLPAIIDAIADIIGRLVEFILQHLPEFIQRGFDIIMALIQGILDNLPAIISTVAQLIVTIIKAIIENLPKILIQGADILMQLIMGLISAIPQLIAAIPQIIMAIIDAFRNTDWGEVGRNILQGIKDGLFSMVGNIVDGVRNIAGRIANGFKNFFGIHSPSKLMRDQVGKMLGLGFAEGIDESAGEAVKSAEDMAKDVLGTMDGIDAELSSGIGDINVGRAGVNGNGNGLTATGAGVTINVYGAVGQDVNELAEIISQKIAFTTQRERAAWA